MRATVAARLAVPRRAARAALAAGLAAALLAGAGPAWAHRVRPEQVLAELRAEPLRSAFGVIDVARDPRLPRLLVIRVDARWRDRDPARRVRAAEAWRALWREAAPAGVVAVTDAEGRSLVGFDGRGRAHLHER